MQFTLVFLSMLISAIAEAEPKRISAIAVNQAKVQSIRLTPGLASVVLFPCEIDEAIIGRNEDLKATVSPTTKRNLILHLAKGSSLSTNLIVRCGDEEIPFVFDVIPSRAVHQDLVRVASRYGGPEVQPLISESEARAARNRREDAELRAIIARKK